MFLRIALLVPLLACEPFAASETKTTDTSTTDTQPDDIKDSADLRDSDNDDDDDDDTDETEDTGWDATTDTDADGITDLEEGRDDAGSRDTDGDGIADYLDEDSDGDGLLDLGEAIPRGSDGGVADTDADGVPDYLDTDSDGDGIRDSVEGATGIPDTDADGTPDYRDTDTDDDGLLDALEGTDDWDGDGLDNWRDAYNDNNIGALVFTALTTEFNSPIGIDFEEAAKTVAVSVNYSGGSPYALETILPDGSHVQFSSLSGVTDEVKIATVRSGGSGGFTTGELFVGNGTDGQIVRISADGATVTNPWVDLPNANNGLMRGSLYIDRTGVWGGELIVATTDGEVWRIDNAGVPMPIADLPGIHLEGMITVPDAPTRFGPLAGTIIAGSENEGLLYSIATDGTVTAYNVGVAVEDIDIIMPFENFFGVNYGTSKIIGVRGDGFLPIAGDILLTQESVSSVGLYRLYWDGVDLRTVELTAAAGSDTIGQWEHTTFADAGIAEVPD
ncbi:hypothetical protein LBMAG42_48900 [Deltaproteobacteria bacterium]|nr:hypothetical protein LBMAG42_48900 [Deltaproteobacteria bacterium]